jgi:hypothetical protein
MLIKVFFCLIISYLQIKSYNVLNYNNCSADWPFPLMAVNIYIQCIEWYWSLSSQSLPLRIKYCEQVLFMKMENSLSLVPIIDILWSFSFTRLGVVVFHATFNNNSVISWRSVVLLEETGVPGLNYRPVACLFVFRLFKKKLLHSEY